MVVTVTATASGATTVMPLSTNNIMTTVSNPSSQSSDSPSPTTEPTAPTSPLGSVPTASPAMHPFTPGQCLFCPTLSPTSTDSASHMQTAHGLFIPRRERLLVGLETLLAHLHLVVFGYRECLACGTVRASVAAVQMHMRGKGHCRFEVGEASEFGAFYDFGQEEGGAADATDGDGDAQVEDGAAGVRSGPVLMADGASVRLPSGRLVGRKSSTRPLQPPSSRSRRPRQQSPPAVPLESWPSPPQPKEAAVSPDDDPADVSTTRTALTRREKRARAVETMQLARLGASDRSSLAHLSAAQQRALLVTQARQAERGQKEEGRRRARVDRKGNKNLYAYWHTETPVYQCG